jgi:hypothetical protein
MCTGASIEIVPLQPPSTPGRPTGAALALAVRPPSPTISPLPMLGEMSCSRSPAQPVDGEHGPAGGRAAAGGKTCLYSRLIISSTIVVGLGTFGEGLDVAAVAELRADVGEPAISCMRCEM